jgi:hypothetical protein
VVALPAGWPRDLPPGGTSEFDAKIVGWLLDRGPADLRMSPIRQHPIALARLVSRVVAAELDATRQAYASARVELRDYLTPDEVSVVHSALEAEGARLLQVQREVALVEDVLRRQANMRSGNVRPPA